jgi:hypothetical protein
MCTQSYIHCIYTQQTTVQTNRLKGKVVDEYGNEDGEGQSYNQNNSNSSSGKTGDSFSHNSDKKSNNKYSKDTAVDGKSDEVCVLTSYTCSRQYML